MTLISYMTSSNMASDSSYSFSNPKRLKTLAFDAKCDKGDNLLHRFVLDNSEPNHLQSEHYINGTLRSMSDMSVNALNGDGYTALHLAVLKKNFVLLKKMLHYIPNIDVNACCGKFGNTPLHLAAQVSHVDIIQELLDKGANVNKPNNIFEIALCFALELGDLSTIKILVKNGADIHYSFGETGLHCAIRHSASLEIIKFLLSSGANPNNFNIELESSLHLAIRHAASLEIVEFLICKGADANYCNDYEETPLHYAIKHSARLEILEFLIISGSDADRSNKYGETPLHYAMKYLASLEIVKFLINNGAGLGSGYGGFCDTPLHYAVKHSARAEVVEFLLQCGASVNIRNKIHETPLHYAVKHSATLEIVKYLIRSGANIDSRNKYGETSLHYAVKKLDSLEIVKLLAGCGAAVNSPDKNLETPLHYAAREGHVEIVKLLLDEGADRNAKNKEGITPHDLAEERNHHLCISVLKNV